MLASTMGQTDVNGGRLMAMHRRGHMVPAR
jgi:hypothetical protein